jgi:hypothetical protein
VTAAFALLLLAQAAVAAAASPAPAAVAPASPPPDAAASAATSGAASPALPGAALTAVLRSVKQDGPLKLSPEAQADLVALVPPARRGEECPERAQFAGEAHALKDRGSGAVIVADLDTCKGGRVFAFAPGTPTRVARLLDAGEGTSVRSVKALNLRAGKHEDDLGVELATSPTTSELRLFSHRDTGFAFSESGELRDFASTRECASAGDEGGGWSSFVRVEKAGLQLLRTDASCGGAPWQASCQLFRLEQDALSRSGVCALPMKLDPKSLRASGWR